MTGDGFTVLYPAARWLGYLAAFLVVGAAATRWLVLPRLRSVNQEAADAAAATSIRSARIGAVLFAVALIARLYLQSRSLLEPEEPLTAAFVVAVLSSTWGKGWLAQATAALLALIGWRWLSRRPGSRWATGIAALGSLGLVATAPLTGHAVGLPNAPGYAPLLDLVHFGAGAAWLGTLGSVVAIIRRRGRGGGSTAALIEAYSPIALVAGLTTMVAGVILALAYLGGLAPLISTGYGRILLVKLGAITVTAGIGTYNWRVVRPRLRRGLPAPILRSATLEMFVGLVILAVTAVLVALPAPGESAE